MSSYPTLIKLKTALLESLGMTMIMKTMSDDDDDDDDDNNSNNNNNNN